MARCGSLWLTAAHCGPLWLTAWLAVFTVAHCVAQRGSLLWLTVAHCALLGLGRLTVAWLTVIHCGSESTGAAPRGSPGAEQPPLVREGGGVVLRSHA